MATKLMLTSGEVVQAEHVREDIYRLPDGTLVHTWTEDGQVYEDSEAAPVEDDGPVVARCVEPGCTCVDRAGVMYASRQQVPAGYEID